MEIANNYFKENNSCYLLSKVQHSLYAHICNSIFMALKMFGLAAI